MNQTTAAQVASFIDGEGCLTRKKWTRTDGTLVVVPSVWITNTARSLIDWFQERFGGYTSTVEPRSTWKIVHRWILQGLAARELVRECARWFIIKGNQVRWFLQYRLGPGLRPRDYAFNWRISERIRKLNKRGR